MEYSIHDLLRISPSQAPSPRIGPSTLTQSSSKSSTDCTGPCGGQCGRAPGQCSVLVGADEPPYSLVIWEWITGTVPLCAAAKTGISWARSVYLASRSVPCHLYPNDGGAAVNAYITPSISDHTIHSGSITFSFEPLW